MLGNLPGKQKQNTKNDKEGKRREILRGLHWASLVLSGLLTAGCLLINEEYIKTHDKTHHLANQLRETSTNLVFQLRGDSFANGGAIPSRHGNTSSPNGRNISPGLSWSNPPIGTQSFALIMREIETGNVLHWGVYNIPAQQRNLPENASQEDYSTIEQTENEFGGHGYYGPSSHRLTHKYIFTLYALPQKSLGPNLTSTQLQEEVKRSLGRISLIGYFVAK